MDLGDWFVLRVEASSGDCVIYPIGELDLATAHMLVEAADDVQRSGATHPKRVNLSRLSFIDMHGMRALITLRERGFEITEARGFIRRVIVLAGLDDLIG